MHRDIIEKEILLMMADKTLKLDATVTRSLFLNGEEIRLLREAVARMENGCKLSGDHLIGEFRCIDSKIIADL